MPHHFVFYLLNKSKNLIKHKMMGHKMVTIYISNISPKYLVLVCKNVDFILSNFHFYLMNTLVYDNIDKGIHKIKMKVVQNEK